MRSPLPRLSSGCHRLPDHTSRACSCRLVLLRPALPTPGQPRLPVARSRNGDLTVGGGVGHGERLAVLGRRIGIHPQPATLTSIPTDLLLDDGCVAACEQSGREDHATVRPPRPVHALDLVSLVRGTRGGGVEQRNLHVWIDLHLPLGARHRQYVRRGTPPDAPWPVPRQPPGWLVRTAPSTPTGSPPRSRQGLGGRAGRGRGAPTRSGGRRSSARSARPIPAQGRAGTAGSCGPAHTAGIAGSSASATDPTVAVPAFAIPVEQVCLPAQHLTDEPVDELELIEAAHGSVFRQLRRRPATCSRGRRRRRAPGRHCTSSSVDCGHIPPDVPSANAGAVTGDGATGSSFEPARCHRPRGCRRIGRSRG